MSSYWSGLAWPHHRRRSSWTILADMTPEELRHRVETLAPIIQNFPPIASNTCSTRPQQTAQKSNSTPKDTQVKANKARAEAFLDEFNSRVGSPAAATHIPLPRQPEVFPAEASQRENGICVKRQLILQACHQHLQPLMGRELDEDE